MGMVFEGSICTLAAIDAMCDTEKDVGLFLDRDMLPVKISIESSLSVTYDIMLSELSHQSEMREYQRNGTSLDVEALSSNAWIQAKVILTAEHTTFDMSVEKSLWNSRVDLPVAGFVHSDTLSHQRASLLGMCRMY